MRNEQNGLKRSGYLLSRKLRHYLLTTTITAVALSLNEFVDSLLVAQLLDASAMTVINVGMPITLIMNALFVLLGAGGATLYAVSVGEHDTDRAGRVFSVAMLAAAAVSVLITAAGLGFRNSVADLLCKDPTLTNDLRRYLNVRFLSAPLIVCVMTFTVFMPSAGSPVQATAISVIANVVNLIFDYVYIRVFGMGVEGAAWATITGYAAAVGYIAYLLLCRKMHIHTKMPKPADFRLLGEISAQGSASSLTQIGYAVKFAFFNGLAATLGGSAALTALSVCLQLISIISIALSGICESLLPIAATLHGQKDRKGIRTVLGQGYLWVFISSAALVLLFEIFPQAITALYNVKDPEVIEVATRAMRIFQLMFIFRAGYVLHPHYVRIIGHKIYAVVISLLDGVGFPVLAALILPRAFKLDGVWCAFPAAALITLIFVLISNRVLIARSKGRLEGFFLIEREEDESRLSDITITENDAQISELSRELSGFCQTNGIDAALSGKVGLIAEEMSVYTRLHNNKTAFIDILTRVTDSAVTLDFRSEGLPFNPLAETDSDYPENLLLLRKMSSEIAYDYILGMNSTRIRIDR